MEPIINCLLEANICQETTLAAPHSTVRRAAARLLNQVCDKAEQSVLPSPHPARFQVLSKPAFENLREEQANRLTTIISESMDPATLYGAFCGAVALRLPMEGMVIDSVLDTHVDQEEWMDANGKLVEWVQVVYRNCYVFAMQELAEGRPASRCYYCYCLNELRYIVENLGEPLLAQLPYSPGFPRAEAVRLRQPDRRIFYAESLRCSRKRWIADTPGPRITPLMFDKSVLNSGAMEIKMLDCSPVHGLLQFTGKLCPVKLKPRRPSSVAWRRCEYTGKASEGFWVSKCKPSPFRWNRILCSNSFSVPL